MKIFTSTKNLGAKGEWLEARFDDLMRRIDKKMKISKRTGSVTLTLEEAEYESIIDGLKRAKKTGYLKDDIRELKKEVNELDQKLDNKAWKELLALEWAQKAIPKKGAKPAHYRKAVLRAGLKIPSKGRRETFNSEEVVSFYNLACKTRKKQNGNKPLTTGQKMGITNMVQEKFDFQSYHSTCQYLYKHGVKNLVWPQK